MTRQKRKLLAETSVAAEREFRAELEQEIRLKELAGIERIHAIRHQTASMEYHRTAYEQASVLREHTKIVKGLEDGEIEDLHKKLRECRARIESYEQEIESMNDQETQAGAATASEAASQGGQSQSPPPTAPPESVLPSTITGHTQESSTIVGVNIFQRAIVSTPGAQIQGISAMDNYEGKGPRWFIHYTIASPSEQASKEINKKISDEYSRLSAMSSN